MYMCVQPDHIIPARKAGKQCSVILKQHAELHTCCAALAASSDSCSLTFRRSTSALSCTTSSPCSSIISSWVCRGQQQKKKRGLAQRQRLGSRKKAFQSSAVGYLLCMRCCAAGSTWEPDLFDGSCGARRETGEHQQHRPFCPLSPRPSAAGGRRLVGR